MLKHTTIKLDGTHFTPEGYLMDTPIVTRVGVFDYSNPDGTIRREARLPEHVFDPASLKSYKGKPIILSHSTPNGGTVDSTDYKDHEVGTILHAYQDGDYVRCEIVIKDVEAVKNQEARELSLAYHSKDVQKSGQYGEEPFDIIQTEIRVNNLAIVGQARAGAKARLNLDEEETKMQENKDPAVTADAVVHDDALKDKLEDALEDAIEDVLDNVLGGEPATVELDAETEPTAEPTEGGYKEGYDAGYKAAVAYMAQALEKSAEKYVKNAEPTMDAEIIIDPDDDVVKLDSAEHLDALLDVRETAGKLGISVKGLTLTQARAACAVKAMPSIKLDGLDANTAYSLAVQALSRRKPVSEQYAGMAVKTDGATPGQSSYDTAQKKYQADFYGDNSGGDK